jgi:hypothetical protein
MSAKRSGNTTTQSGDAGAWCMVVADVEVVVEWWQMERKNMRVPQMM